MNLLQMMILKLAITWQMIPAQILTPNDEVDRTYLWITATEMLGTGEDPTHVYDPVNDFVRSSYGVLKGTDILVTYKIGVDYIRRI